MRGISSECNGDKNPGSGGGGSSSLRKSTSLPLPFIKGFNQQSAKRNATLASSTLLSGGGRGHCDLGAMQFPSTRAVASAGVAKCRV